METQVEKVFRVRSTTSCKQLGSAIAHAIYDGHSVALKAIGHGPLGQASKGVAIAEGHAAQQLIRLKSNFGWFTTEIGGEETCGVVIRVVRD